MNNSYDISDLVLIHEFVSVLSVPTGPNYSMAEPGVPQNAPLTEAEVFPTFSPQNIDMSIQGSMADETGMLELEPSLELQSAPVMPSATPNSEDMIESLSLEDSSASVKVGGELN